MHEFRFDIEFAGTASNGVEIAFGVDADGDGELSDGETDISAGWDCGELFVADNSADERSAEPSVDGVHVFSCVCRTRSDGRTVHAAFADNGSPVFPGLAASMPGRLYSPDWNIVRLVGRGENVRSGERFSVKATSFGLLFRLK